MDLGEDGAARRFPPNIRLRGSAIDSEENYVEDIVQDMVMEVEVVEEEYLKKMITPLKGLRSVPNVLNCYPLNDKLFSFVITMQTFNYVP